MSDRYCPFLVDNRSGGFWGASYRCKVTDKEIYHGNSDQLFANYCGNYEKGWSSCPHFNGGGSGQSSSSGGCFLSSACTEARGLPDDCHELSILRDFRDNWLKLQPGGEEEIAKYYACAPSIVRAIHAKPDCTARLEQLYNDMVLPCVRLIEARQFEDAHSLYREQINVLLTQYECTNR